MRWILIVALLACAPLVGCQSAEKGAEAMEYKTVSLEVSGMT